MVNLFIPREIADHETRVAATPETVSRYVRMGCSVSVESGAGKAAHFLDDDYRSEGATIIADAASGWSAADFVLKVREPIENRQAGRHEVDLMKDGANVVSFLVPQQHPELVKKFLDRKIGCFSMNLIPRITRAQKMDALSSQANVAGYKAAILAAEALPKYFPLLMTAAGTVKPAKVVVMGAGVAGLQAIATAKRLGAQVWATDVRLAAKEQVESLGARFIDVPGMEDLEDERGYAKEATPEFLAKQKEVVGNHIAESDVVITTALVPGRRAPILIEKALVARMRPGSVIVDLAGEQGGNCEETVLGETVERGGVKVIGPRNLPGTVAVHASELYARNVQAFIQPLIKEGELAIDLEDEIVAGSLVTWQGEVKHGPTAEALATGEVK